MGLIKYLLKEFDANQLSIGDLHNDEKIKKSLDKIKSKVGNRPTEGMSKQDALNILNTSHELAQDALDSAMHETDRLDQYLNMDYYGDEIKTTLYDKFENIGDKMVDWHSISNIIQTYDDADKVYDPKDEDDLDEMRKFFLDNDMPFEPFTLYDDWEDLEDIIVDVYLAELGDELAKKFITWESIDYLDDIYDVVNSNTIQIDGKDCMPIFRAIRIDLSDDYPLYPDSGLGEFWSYEESFAVPHGAMGKGTDIVVHAYVPLGSINWTTTLHKTFWDLRDEREIETYKGVDIYIQKIVVNDRDIQNKSREQAELIFKTYFKKKYEKMDNHRDRIIFLNKLQDYLDDRGIIKKEFSITFDEYYKSIA